MTNRKIDGPQPMYVTATRDGAELDIDRFLRTMFLELATHAAEDPEGVAEELAELGELAQSAQCGVRDSHARHELDDRMNQMIDQYADGGRITLYGRGITQLAAAMREMAAPRPLPGQHEEGAA